MLRVRTKTSYEISGVKQISLEVKLNTLSEVSESKLKTFHNFSTNKSPVLHQKDCNKLPTRNFQGDHYQTKHLRKLSSKQSPFSTFNSVSKCNNNTQNILIERNTYRNNGYPRQSSSSVKASATNSGTRKSNLENKFITKTYNRSAKVVPGDFSKTIQFMPFNR